MFSELTRLMLVLLATASFASIIYCVLYFTFCLAEHVSRYLVLVMGLLIPSYCLFFHPRLVDIGMIYGEVFKDFLPYLVFTSLFGALIHRSIDKGSRTLIYSLAMMFITSVSGFSILFIIDMTTKWLAHTPIYLLRDYPFVIRLLITTQLLTPPTLLWMIKSSRLRPGVDEHLNH